MVRQSSSLTDQLGFSYKLSETPPREASRAPELGEHTAELLAAVGISREDRDRLSEAGVIVARE